MQQQPEADPPRVPQRARVLDLSEQEYRQWRHHPMSEVLLQFLADRRAVLRADLADRFLSASLQTVNDPSALAYAIETRGRVLESQDFGDMDWETVRMFYGIETESERENDGA